MDEQEKFYTSDPVEKTPDMPDVQKTDVPCPEMQEAEHEIQTQVPPAQSYIHTPVQTAPCSNLPERMRRENEAYARFVQNLQAELDSIRKEYPDTESDRALQDEMTRLETLAGDMGNLKSDLQKMKEILEKISASGIPNQQTAQFVPQPFTAPGYFPQYISSTPAIMQAPSLPYIQTPTYTPAITLPPVLGNNNK